MDERHSVLYNDRCLDTLGFRQQLHGASPSFRLHGHQDQSTVDEEGPRIAWKV